MNRTVAENIYNIAEKELTEKGYSDINTIEMMKREVEKEGKDFLTYFWPEGNKMIFNLKRFKRHFLENREDN